MKMAIEPRRGCGYRQVGNIYLVSDGPHEICGLLPRELDFCPACGEGVKQKIGWQWVQARLLTTAEDVNGCEHREIEPTTCQMVRLARDPLQRVGLIWVGTKFYPTPAEFLAEAQSMGISRRIHAVPRDFALGSSWVILAHPKAIALSGSRLDAMRFARPGHDARVPGVFGLFRPTRIEQIITDTQAADEELRAALRKRGITPVVVPDDDRDHNPGGARPRAVAAAAA